MYVVNVSSERIKMPKRKMNWANSKFLAIIKPYTEPILLSYA
jgi:hypothetical protein